MNDLEDNIDEDHKFLTIEEKEKIYSIEKVSFVNCEKVKEEKPKPFSFLNIFGLNLIPEYIIGGITRQAAPFDIQRRIGLNKIVTINNISGKTAYVILTPAPIKTIETIGIGVKEVSFNLHFSDEGEYKSQQIPILNNQRSEYDLDNSQFYCTVFLHIDEKWKKAWENRKFNGRKFDINILERHVTLANELETFQLTLQ
jgi:hypothetical protein